jgi:colicin import membrane protein
MAWSYRTDRADELYNTEGGPATVTGELLTKPPEGSTDPQKRAEREKELRESMSELPAASGITAADLVVLERQREDPQAGPEVESPAKRLARESELVNTTQELNEARRAGEERNRMRMEERARIQGEEREKENEKARKEVADQVKKEEADRKAKEDKEKAKSQPQTQPTAFGASPR